MQKIKSDLREVLNRILLLVIVALGVNSVLMTHPRLKAQEARRGGPIPYTVILRETVYGPNGTASVAMDETFAVRSDGSYVHVLKHKKQIETELVDSDSARTIRKCPLLKGRWVEEKARATVGRSVAPRSFLCLMRDIGLIAQRNSPGEYP